MLVQANNRPLRIVRAMVDRQHVLHLGYESGGGFPDAPGFDLPGLEFVFFSRLKSATWEMLSRCPRATIWSASRRSVQRLCPSGASLQASTVSCASISPVILG